MNTFEAPPRDSLTNPSQTIEWGGISFRANYAPVTMSEAVLQGLRTDVESSRSGRAGVIGFVLDDLSDGLRPRSQVGDWGRQKRQQYRNTGIITHIPKVASLAYLNTVQDELVAGDYSGLKAANKRIHGIMYKGRFYAFTDNLMLRSGASDPALEAPGTPGIDGSVTATALLVANGTRYLAIAGNATDGIKGTTDGTASSISWTTIAALANTPYINAMAHVPIGPGVNIVIGKPSNALGNGVFWFAQNESLPATLKPVVYRDTKDEPGDLSAVTVGPIAFTNGSQDGSPSTGRVRGRWQNTGNILTSNNSDATSTDGDDLTDTSGLTPYLIASAPSAASIDALPQNADVLGVVFRVEAAKDGPSAPDTAAFETAAFMINGSQGINHGDGRTLITSDANYDFGSTSDNHGFSNMKVRDLYGAGEVVRFAWNDSTPTYTIYVDHMTLLSVTYKEPGTTVSTVATGGFFVGPIPSSPNILPVIEPLVDDTSDVVTMRRLVYYTFSWDTNGSRPVVDVSYPATGLPYCGGGCTYMGGTAVAGGNDHIVWDQVKLVGPDGQTRDLGFPTVHGDKPQTITRMVAQGNALLVEVANTDGSDAQLWMYFSEKWYALGPIQSYSHEIASLPIPWAESSLNTALNYSTRFFPVSTTHLASSYEFVPRDLFTDPHLTNTTVKKTDGEAYVQLGILDGSAPEALKTITRAQLQTYQVDGTANDDKYGTVKLAISTTGDLTMADPEVEVTFGNGSDETPAFEYYDVPDSGVDFRTMAIRLTGAHEEDSAKTPNLLPVIIEFVGEWDAGELVKFWVPAADNHQLFHDIERLYDKRREKNVQKLNGAGFLSPAQFLKHDWTYKPAMTQTQPGFRETDGAWLWFRLVRGSVESAGA